MSTLTKGWVTHPELATRNRGTLARTRPDDVQLDGGARVLEDVLRVGVGQLRGVQVVEAHDAVAHVKHALASRPDRYLKREARCQG